jgi:hypothetical protein
MAAKNVILPRRLGQGGWIEHKNAWLVLADRWTAGRPDSSNAGRASACAWRADGDGPDTESDRGQVNLTT